MAINPAGSKIMIAIKNWVCLCDLNPSVVFGKCVCVCVCLGLVNCMCDWVHSPSLRLSIDQQISVPYPANRCSLSSPVNRMLSSTNTSPSFYCWTAASDVVWCSSQSAIISPADSALWKPSPWELLHMLRVVVRETWLNNSPSTLMHSVT